MNDPADDRVSSACASRGSGRALWRFTPVAVVLVLIALAYGFGLHREISFETLVRHRVVIDRFIDENFVAAVAAFVLLYIAVVGLSLPGGAVLTVTGGLLFGTVVGSIAAVGGALVGATIIFLIARSAAGESLTRRAGPFAARFAEGFRANAFSYLLFLRLAPFPFWLVNLVPALFGVPLSTYVAATAIGILPGTVAFAMFGAGLGSVVDAEAARYYECVAKGMTSCSVDFDLSHILTPTLLCALSALGALALVPGFAKRFLGRRAGAGAPSKTP